MGLQYIKHKLQHCSDVQYHTIQLNQQITCTFIYIETIIDSNKLEEYLFKPLLAQEKQDLKQLMKQIESGTIFPIATQSITELEQTVFSILEGYVALFIHGESTHYVFPLTQYENRSVDVSQNEMVIIGPQEAFIENLKTNLSLLRHRIRHPDLKIDEFTLGNYTKTAVRMLYIEGRCEPELVKKIATKISNIKADSILGINHIAERLEKHNYSLFPEVQYTERPDTLAASLMEGRIAIMIEGTPMSLILPVTFFTLMLSAEDYYQRFISATWIRWIRFVFMLLSFLFPSVYVAISTFHPEMIPDNLLRIIAAARENVPFPTLVEALLMEVTFEGLREAGIRIPKPIGQTISILGAIVIGQAAVQAGFVSASIVIIVSITGIASFIIPHFELGLSLRLIRFPIMILGGTLGLYGVIIGLYLLGCHLVTLESFGKPYMEPLAPIKWKQWKDIFFRFPWWAMDKFSTPYGQHKKRGRK